MVADPFVSDYRLRKAARVQAAQELAQTRKVKCSACAGSGVYDHNGSPPCGACGGTGKMRVKITATSALFR